MEQDEEDIFIFRNYPPADVLYYDAFLAPEMDEEEEWFDH